MRLFCRPERCVCGHSKDSHRGVLMSVPLVNPNPKSDYILAGQRFSNVALTHPYATYDHDECHCGCCEYLVDDGRE